MHSWMEVTLAKLSRKSDTAVAIRYASSRWRPLTRYVDDGQLDIDNNAAERALRVVALGRKTTFSADPTPEENELQPSTPCSAQPGSTTWIQNSISITSSNTSPIIPSPGSKTSCRGA
jgi:Transposase IS66 family